MDNAKNQVRGLNQLFWKKIFVLKTIPYSPQCNAIERSFSQAKAYVSRLYFNRLLFAERLTIVKNNLLEKRYQELIEQTINKHSAAAIGDVYDARNLEIELRNLETQHERERVHINAETTNPLVDKIDGAVFIELIQNAFSVVSEQNCTNYHVHTLKVAFCCTLEIPLENDDKFTHNVKITDPVLSAIIDSYCDN
ncbi:hypothetical protein EIN_110430 [Entamoeba invadens IP1]|uniref:Uncharacterized protein n=1 Tax=Entamoeba invadens IP1 TaxID=370355 RepID=A0A0A1U3P9_ENTIV|nr:hypothetical protein EIN_110430 [Entamoeba invadens IP1]ELP86219.1 hypothetical protein EIN_110430 [Entamoeba invadens IP1]|eukprot:XP_004185565.1 hypothetical protein EIN_110430 [Entamoeba invadens IP1]